MSIPIHTTAQISLSAEGPAGLLGNPVCLSANLLVHNCPSPLDQSTCVDSNPHNWPDTLVGWARWQPAITDQAGSRAFHGPARDQRRPFLMGIDRSIISYNCAAAILGSRNKKLISDSGFPDFFHLFSTQCEVLTISLGRQLL